MVQAQPMTSGWFGHTVIFVLPGGVLGKGQDQASTSVQHSGSALRQKYHPRYMFQADLGMIWGSE